jgi:hypothetical protein
MYIDLYSGKTETNLGQYSKYLSWHSNTAHPQILVHNLTSSVELLGPEYELLVTSAVLGFRFSVGADVLTVCEAVFQLHIFIAW